MTQIIFMPFRAALITYTLQFLTSDVKGCCCNMFFHDGILFKCLWVFWKCHCLCYSVYSSVIGTLFIMSLRWIKSFVSFLRKDNCILLHSHNPSSRHSEKSNWTNNMLNAMSWLSTYKEALWIQIPNLTGLTEEMYIFLPPWHFTFFFSPLHFCPFWRHYGTSLKYNVLVIHKSYMMEKSSFFFFFWFREGCYCQYTSLWKSTLKVRPLIHTDFPTLLLQKPKILLSAWWF